MFKLILVALFALASFGQIEALISDLHKYYENSCSRRSLFSIKPPIEREYDKINKYLESTNCSTLNECIKTIESLNLREFESNKGKLALDNLRDLINLNGNTRCNRRSIEILIQNEKATRCRSRKPIAQSRTIDRLVRYHLLQHERDCQNVYPARFRSLSKPLNVESVKRVEALTIGYIYGGTLYVTEAGRVNQWTACESLDSLKTELEPLLPLTTRNLLDSGKFCRARDIYLALKYFGSQRPEEANSLKSTADNRIEDLLNKYILKPCQYYVESLGPNLFDLAIFDSSILEAGDEYKSHVLSNFDYYLGQAGYKLCQNIRARKSLLIKKLKAIMDQS